MTCESRSFEELVNSELRASALIPPNAKAAPIPVTTRAVNSKRGQSRTRALKNFWMILKKPMTILSPVSFDVEKPSECNGPNSSPRKVPSNHNTYAINSLLVACPADPGNAASRRCATHHREGDARRDATPTTARQSSFTTSSPSPLRGWEITGPRFIRH